MASSSAIRKIQIMGNSKTKTQFLQEINGKEWKETYRGNV